jgi:aryl-alcohol dehydrogenase-like predicted oxidoreductase
VGSQISQVRSRRERGMGDDIVSIPGRERRKYLEHNLGALEVRFTEGELKQLDVVAPKGVAAGTRYPEKL